MKSEKPSGITLSVNRVTSKLPVVSRNDDLKEKIKKTISVLNDVVQESISETIPRIEEYMPSRTMTRREACKHLKMRKDSQLKELLSNPNIHKDMRGNQTIIDDQTLWDALLESDGWLPQKTEIAQVTSFLGHKGGIGKTTCCVNLSMATARSVYPMKEFVCIIDMDPQGNATKQLLSKDEDKLSPHSKHETAVSLLVRYMQGEDITIQDIMQVFKRTKMANAFLIPSHEMFDVEAISKIVSLHKIACSLNEEELAAKEGKGYFAIHGKYSYSFYMIFYFAIIEPLKQQFKHIYIDSPPQMTEVTKMISLASTHIISPLVPSDYELATAKTMLIDLKAAIRDIKYEIDTGVIPTKDFKFLILNKQLSRLLSASIVKKLRTELKDEMLISVNFESNPAVEKCASIQDTAVTVNKKYYRDIVGGSSSDDLKRLISNIEKISIEIQNTPHSNASVERTLSNFDGAITVLQKCITEVIQESYKKNDSVSYGRTLTRTEVRKYLKLSSEKELTKLLSHPDIHKDMRGNQVVIDLQTIWDSLVANDFWKPKIKSSTLVVAFGGQKGGLGKSTSCVNISMAVAYDAMPEKAFTCIIDMDPQGNTSKQVLHKDEQALDRTSTYSTALNLMTRYMQGEDIGINDILPILKRTKMANTFLIPSHELFDTESISKLVGLYKEACNLSEAELREKGGKGYFGIHGKYSYSFYMVFHFAVIKPLKEHFDYVFIDSPPQMSEVTKMIFLASTHIISPLSPSEYEINTAKTLLLDLDAAFDQNYEAIESGVLPKKEVKFLLINRQASRQLSSNISDKLSRHLNDNMLLKPDFEANAAVEKCSSIRETAVTVNRKYYKDIIGRNSSDDLKRLTDNLTDIAVKIRNFII